MEDVSQVRSTHSTEVTDAQYTPTQKYRDPGCAARIPVRRTSVPADTHMRAEKPVGHEPHQTVSAGPDLWVEAPQPQGAHP